MESRWPYQLRAHDWVRPTWQEELEAQPRRHSAQAAILAITESNNGAAFASFA
jgi:hypothetical protein